MSTALAPSRTPLAPNRDIARFSAEGYVLIDERLDAAVIDEARARLDAMLARVGPEHRPECLVEPHAHAVDWQFWLSLCRHPRVLDHVAACLGSDELLLMMSHLIVKPPRDGLPLLWHQDNTYWPSVHGTEIVTVWLALDDADLENGCMEIIPTTHVGAPALQQLPTDGSDLLRTQVAVTPAQEATAMPAALKAGAMSIHDSFVIHGSKPNTSARRRAGYTMRYGDARTVRVDAADHGKPVYYVRGSGQHLLPGIHDLRPQRPLPANARPDLSQAPAPRF